MKKLLIIFAGFLLISFIGPNDKGLRWWKGNIHTHSLWSDGTDYPEVVVDWYKKHGYNFLALSEHNVIADKDCWIKVEDKTGTSAFDDYLKTFGTTWVEQKYVNDTLTVRLKTINECKALFEQKDTFMIVRSEEVTSRFEDKRVHFNVININNFIEAPEGKFVQEIMRKIINEVTSDEIKYNNHMLVNLNHPNFIWSITADDITYTEGLKFFEVYNGYPRLNKNEGDSTHISTDKMWDIVLTNRLLNKRSILYAIACDDAHNCHDIANLDNAIPGRGWIVIRAKDLDADELVSSMDRGDFYASTGVELEDIIVSDKKIEIKIKPEKNVSYKTLFIGTRIVGGIGTIDQLRDVSGVVLAEVEGTNPSYNFKGNEIYVRAKIISSKPKENTSDKSDYEVAWIQPVVVNNK